MVQALMNDTDRRGRSDNSVGSNGSNDSPGSFPSETTSGDASGCQPAGGGAPRSSRSTSGVSSGSGSIEKERLRHPTALHASQSSKRVRGSGLASQDPALTQEQAEAIDVALKAARLRGGPTGYPTDACASTSSQSTSTEGNSAFRACSASAERQGMAAAGSGSGEQPRRLSGRKRTATERHAEDAAEQLESELEEDDDNEYDSEEGVSLGSNGSGSSGDSTKRSTSRGMAGSSSGRGGGAGTAASGPSANRTSSVSTRRLRSEGGANTDRQPHSREDSTTPPQRSSRHLRGRLKPEERARLESFIRGVITRRIIVRRGDLARSLQEYINPARSRPFYEKLVSRRALNVSLYTYLQPRLFKKRRGSGTTGGPLEDADYALDALHSGNGADAGFDEGSGAGASRRGSRGTGPSSSNGTSSSGGGSGSRSGNASRPSRSVDSESSSDRRGDKRAGSSRSAGPSSFAPRNDRTARAASGGNRFMDDDNSNNASDNSEAEDDDEEEEDRRRSGRGGYYPSRSVRREVDDLGGGDASEDDTRDFVGFNEDSELSDDGSEDGRGDDLMGRGPGGAGARQAATATRGRSTTSAAAASASAAQQQVPAGSARRHNRGGGGGGYAGTSRSGTKAGAPNNLSDHLGWWDEGSPPPVAAAAGATGSAAAGLQSSPLPASESPSAHANPRYSGSSGNPIESTAPGPLSAARKPRGLRPYSLEAAPAANEAARDSGGALEALFSAAEADRPSAARLGPSRASARAGASYR